jgi:hypothetical protein
MIDKPIDERVAALFGDFHDAYTILRSPEGTDTSSTSLSTNDVALVVTDEDGLQLFLPASGEMTDRGLAVVEIYNAMCRDKAGTKGKGGKVIEENAPYAGFTQPFIDKMQGRVG